MLRRVLRSSALVGTAVASGLIPSSVHAAGFALFEQGARGMGFAGAFTAQASDPSAIFHNAAGIAFLKGKQFYLGGTVISPKSDFVGADPFPGAGAKETSDAGVIPTPAAYYTQQFSERMVLGVGVHVPFGLKTQWANPNSYSGRFISELAELKGFSLNPTLAYKLEDRFAVGIGLDIRFSSVTLERRVPVVNPFSLQIQDGASVTLTSNTDHAFGFNLGVLAKPTDSISIGAAYRHKVKASYSGSAAFAAISTNNSQLDARVASLLPGAPVPVTTEIEFPGFASGGIAYTRGDWLVEADVNWYQWSTFDQLALRFEGRSDLDQTIAEVYKNSFQYRIGIQRILNESWTVRGGYFLDKSPAPPESISPLLPDADRNGLAIGGTWSRGRFRADVAGWLVLSKDRSTEGINRDNYNGVYSTKASTLGVSLGYSF